jgi:hypothetical protein
MSADNERTWDKAFFATMASLAGFAAIASTETSQCASTDQTRNVIRQIVAAEKNGDTELYCENANGATYAVFAQNFQRVINGGNEKNFTSCSPEAPARTNGFYVFRPSGLTPGS